MRNILPLMILVVAAWGCSADVGDGADGLDEAPQNSATADAPVPAPPSERREDTVAAQPDVIDKTPGSESRTGVGPTLYNKNVAYTLTLPFAASHAGPITSINYNWGLSYLPSGLSVYLCRQTTSSCTNITASQSGSVSVFNGQSSNVPFILLFQVTGTGTISPAYGQTDQIIVNHS